MKYFSNKFYVRKKGLRKGHHLLVCLTIKYNHLGVKKYNYFITIAILVLIVVEFRTVIIMNKQKRQYNVRYYIMFDTIFPFIKNQIVNT